jgi:uncharacterized protein (DUF58 family)
MIRPSTTLITLSLLLVAIGAAILYDDRFVALWLITLISLLILAIIDAILVWRLPKFDVKRQVDSVIPVGVKSTVKLRLENRAQRSLRLRAYDHHPPHCEIADLVLDTALPVNGWCEHPYQITPNKRGYASFDHTHILVQSPLKLWWRSMRIGEPETIRIYPNFRGMNKFNLFASRHYLAQLGIKKQRRRGEGMDFHQLREYQVGDAMRQINWQASSRVRKLISQEYQDERDQQVYFLIDCGQNMRAKDGNLSHFDHTLNAVLLLARVAINQGDAVGLSTFSGPERHLAPRKGVSQVNLVMNTLFDVEPSLQTADYQTAARDLLTRLHKRALIVLVSNLRDEDYPTLLPALQLLSRHHLVLLASLRETVLKELTQKDILNFDDALAVAGAHHYDKARRQAHKKLSHQGVLHLDIEPRQLAPTAINSYLALKAKGVL